MSTWLYITAGYLIFKDQPKISLLDPTSTRLVRILKKNIQYSKVNTHPSPTHHWLDGFNQCWVWFFIFHRTTSSRYLKYQNKGTGWIWLFHNPQQVL
jgi:hypothetical protein